MRTVQQLIVALEKAAVDEVVTLDARERERELILAAGCDVRRILQQETCRAFPDRPRTRCRQTHRRIRSGEAPVVRAHQIAALDLGYRFQKFFPGIREDRVATLLVKPFKLPPPQHEDAAQNELGHALGMCYGVRERERRAPRSTEHLPARDAEMLAQRFDIGDEMPGRVVGQFGVRRRASTTALIEKNDAVMPRIEESPRFAVESRARTAVQEHDRFAARVAALLVVDAMQWRDLHETGVERFDVGIKRAA